MMKISFVIPCYNSENTIRFVIDEIISVVSEQGEYDFEIIASVDASPDNVLDVLISMAEKDKHIKVLDMAINGGQHAARLFRLLRHLMIPELPHSQCGVIQQSDRQGQTYVSHRVCRQLLSIHYCQLLQLFFCFAVSLCPFF